MTQHAPLIIDIAGHALTKADRRRLNDAEPRKATGLICAGTAHSQRTAHGDRAVPCSVEVLESLGFPTERRYIVHENMRLQIVERPGHTAFFDVSRAHTVKQPKSPKRPRDEARVLQRADAQHAVETFSYHIHFSFRAANFDFEKGMLAQKSG